MGDVFISYRRGDARHEAGRLRAELINQGLLATRIFMDSGIPRGVDFVEYLEERVGSCKALLVVIGPGWLDFKDESGMRRLDSPDDFVRIEVAAALKRRIPVVPVLMDGAKVPPAMALPDDLKALSRRNAASIDHMRFEADVAALFADLRPFLDQADERTGVGKDDGGIEVSVGTLGAQKVVRLSYGQSIRDFEDGPELVLVPPGKFWMGSPDGEGDSAERPRREVTIAAPLLVGRYAVTQGEYRLFAQVATQNKQIPPLDSSARAERMPAVNVSWYEAQEFAAWLRRKTGHLYRLLSEAEWEYCCRSGTETVFSTGISISRSQAQFLSKQIEEVGSFPPNQFGLHDMHGNTWEWCEDVFHKDYNGAPLDGAPWMVGAHSVNASTEYRMLRGGSYFSVAEDLRSARRVHNVANLKSAGLGFRIARSVKRG